MQEPKLIYQTTAAEIPIGIYCLQPAIRNVDVVAVVHQGKLVEQGSHSELIKDPDGAYSGLLRLQEGSNNDPNNGVVEIDRSKLERNMSRPASHRQSSITSAISRNSSSSRSSFTFAFDLPASVSICQTDIENNPAHEKIPEAEEKRRKVSLRRLAGLNKPEIPIGIYCLQPIGRSRDESQKLIYQTTAAVNFTKPLDFSGIEDMTEIVDSSVTGEMMTVSELCSVRQTLRATKSVMDQLMEVAAAASGNDLSNSCQARGLHSIW